MKTNKRNQQYQYAVIAVLGFALFFMAIGFAAYLRFTNDYNASAVSVGLTQRAGFEAGSYQESDSSAVAKTKTIRMHEFDFSIRLNKPGDHYAAMMNVVNLDNTEAILKKLEMSDLGRYRDVIEYRIMLDDEDYIGTTDDINLAILRNGTTDRKQIFINVTYREDAKNIGPINLDLSAKLVFSK
ncbi:hypothetical protein IK110_00380 [Candidatus Saccharibacteria bacterium]|nr:hypothetical protein [Candidatus Saccharibacteria bacterium]